MQLTLRKNALRVLFAVSTYTALAFGRITNSFDKLASDPSYDFVDEIYRLGLKSFVSGSEGYIQIGPRLIAYFAHFFPVQNQAIVLSLLTTALFVFLAFTIMTALSIQTKSQVMGFLGGLCLIAVPAASESTVGNHGSVKWSVVVAACVVFSCPNFHVRHPKFSTMLIVFAILCSPLAIIALAPVFIQCIQVRQKLPRHLSLLLITGLTLTVVQFLYWLFSGKGAKIYGGKIQYYPWEGMGQFWWSIILTPPLFIIGSVVFVSFSKLLLKELEIKHIYLLASSTFLITVSSYITTGIKDSTAVAWQSLSWILSILSLYAVFAKLRIRTLNLLVVVGALVFFGRSIEKWYSASWYLQDSQTWSSLVREASTECKKTEESVVSIQLLLSTVEMPCIRL